MKAAIAGAGIGGLAAALCLQRIGWEVRVHERAPALAEAGAGLQIGPNGARVLEALGLGAALDAIAVRPEAVRLRLHDSGFTVATVPLGAAAERRWGAPYRTVHRADLQQVLLEAVRTRCGKAAVRPGAEVLEADAAEGVLRFSDGSTERADALIGADGLRSRLRAILFGAEAPRFTGHVAWRGLAPAAALPEAAAAPFVTAWLAPRAHAVTYPVRGGELVNFVGVVERDWRVESWNEPGDPAALARDFAGWHPELRAVAQAVAQPFRWALFDRAPMAAWSRGRATLLGDACHPMLPYLAQGAVMALEDAWVLAACLTGGGPVPEALQRYAALRGPRTARVQAAARARGRLFHLGHPLLRLGVFGGMAMGARLLPEAAVRPSDWLFAEDVTRR